VNRLSVIEYCLRSIRLNSTCNRKSILVFLCYSVMVRLPVLWWSVLHSENSDSCMVFGSHSDVHGESYLMGYNALQSGESQPTFRRNVSPQYSCSSFIYNIRSSASNLLCSVYISCWFLALFVLQPWKWRRHVPPKWKLTFTGLLRYIPEDSSSVLTLHHHHNHHHLQGLGLLICSDLQFKGTDLSISLVADLSLSRDLNLVLIKIYKILEDPHNYRCYSRSEIPSPSYRPIITPFYIYIRSIVC
jgi:hypothetical protein